MASADDESDPSVPHRRPLPVSRRRDLVIARTGTDGAPRWTIKDPVALRYFHLHPAEKFVLCQLDGQTSVEQIQQRFARLHAPDRLAADQILTFVHRLLMQGLAISERMGASALLAASGKRTRARERRAARTNLLAIRFRGVDPDRMLTALLPWVSWMMSPAALVAGVVLMIAALAVVFTEWEALLRDLPRFEQMFRADRLVWLAATIAGVKVLHELGHAFACKRLGGECRELGLMLLFFTPCLYCNVSDSWLFRERWRRMAVAGAGIFVELVLASLCTFLWLWSAPGLLHSICLNVMLVASVNTLLLNGNPLLRYDGYYLFSDLVGVPNLRGRAMDAAGAMLLRFFLGESAGGASAGRQTRSLWLPWFGVASWLYSWLVIAAIFWMLYRAAEGRDLQPLVVGGAILVLASRAVGSVRQGVRRVVASQGESRLNFGRFALTALGTLTLLAALFFVPLPRKVRAPALIQARSPHAVFVTTAGRVQPAPDVAPGKQVRVGQVLATLTNRELGQSVARLQAEESHQRRKLELLQSRQVFDPEAAAAIPSVQAALEGAQERLAGLEQELQRLVLRAPVSGMLVTPSVELARTGDELLRRTGSLLDAKNAGAWAESGEMLCEVCPTDARDAVLYVDQAEISQITMGDRVIVTVGQTQGQGVNGVVEEVSSRSLTAVPPALLAAGEIAVQSRPDGSWEPLRPLHEVRVKLNDPPTSLVLHQPGRGVVIAGRESLGTRLTRWLRRTFLFEL